MLERETGFQEACKAKKKKIMMPCHARSDHADVRHSVMLQVGWKSANLQFEATFKPHQ